MKTKQSFHFSLHFGKKLQKIQSLPTAIGMASNFNHRSRRSKIFGYGRRLWPLAFGPTLHCLVLVMNNEIALLLYIPSYKAISLFTYQILIHALISNLLKIALSCSCP